MEWSRAKTILIVAYTLFNMFLGYRLWTDPGRGDVGLVTRQEVEMIAQDLASRGIVLSTAVPRRAPAMPLMLLRHHEITEDEAVALLFEGKDDVRRTEKADGRVILETDFENLVRYENGILVYTRRVRNQPTTEVNEVSARRQAQEFWTKRGGVPPGAKPDYVAFDKKSGRYIVQYYQEHGGFPIYGAQITVVVDPQGVETVLLAWFSPAGPSGRARPILPATEALSRVADAFDSEVVVDSVTLGYYSEAYNAKQWEAPPVWRIRTRSGETLYVNAYTGDLEGPVSIVP